MEEESNGELTFIDCYGYFIAIDYSICEAVYFSESKGSLKSRSDKHKGSVRNCNWVKNKTAKHCWEGDHNLSWDQKKVFTGESG